MVAGRIRTQVLGPTSGDWMLPMELANTFFRCARATRKTQEHPKDGTCEGIPSENTDTAKDTVNRIPA